MNPKIGGIVEYKNERGAMEPWNSLGSASTHRYDVVKTYDAVWTF